MLTGGQVADCTAASLLLERLPPCRILHGDNGYDTNAIRKQIEQHGAMPNIPPKASRRWKTSFSPALYRGRNAIERMFCRLKDFRRIALCAVSGPRGPQSPAPHARGAARPVGTALLARPRARASSWHSPRSDRA